MPSINEVNLRPQGFDEQVTIPPFPNLDRDGWGWRSPSKPTRARHYALSKHPLGCDGGFESS